MLLYWLLLPIIWVLVHLIWRVEVIGKENLRAVRDGRPLVIASNHIANLDPVFIAITVFDWGRLQIPAKLELFRNPLAGWFLRCMGAISIERGKGDTTTLDRMTEKCSKGRGVLIFPEGTRTKDGKLGVLKSGAFVIASSAGADLLPCRILYDTPDGRMRLFCRMRICFGPAIPAAELVIADPSRKVAALRGMKKRLQKELELLLEQNAFPPRLDKKAAAEVETAAETAAQAAAGAPPAPAAAKNGAVPSSPGAADAAADASSAGAGMPPAAPDTAVPDAAAPGTDTVPLLTLDVDAPASPTLETAVSDGDNSAGALS